MPFASVSKSRCRTTNCTGGRNPPNAGGLIANANTPGTPKKNCGCTSLITSCAERSRSSQSVEDRAEEAGARRRRRSRSPRRTSCMSLVRCAIASICRRYSSVYCDRRAFGRHDEREEEAAVVGRHELALQRAVQEHAPTRSAARRRRSRSTAAAARRPAVRTYPLRDARPAHGLHDVVEPRLARATRAGSWPRASASA